MPIGYLLTVAVVATCTTVALVPPRPDVSKPSRASFWLAHGINEVPGLAIIAWLVAPTTLAAVEGDLAGPVTWIAVLVAFGSGAGLVAIARRATTAGPVLADAMSRGLGGDEPAGGWPGVTPATVRRWARAMLWPFPWPHHDVRRTTASYGPGGPANRLDVYRPRHRQPDGPVLVHVPGGAFRSGGKSRQALPLIHRLAAAGWVCISANYHLRSEADFPEPLVDVKRVIAWIRAHGPELGADLDRLVLAGSSAGGQLALTAALTANDPAFQPGFEHTDTTVAGVIALGGWFGPVDATAVGSSPHDHLDRHAPPCLVIHGELDTIVVASDARSFARRLADTSSNPVVYAELPGAHHAFDLFHSIRFEAVIDAIEGFATRVTTPPTTSTTSRPGTGALG